MPLEDISGSGSGWIDTFGSASDRKQSHRPAGGRVDIAMVPAIGIVGRQIRETSLSEPQAGVVRAGSLVEFAFRAPIELAPGAYAFGYRAFSTVVFRAVAFGN